MTLLSRIRSKTMSQSQRRHIEQNLCELNWRKDKHSLWHLGGKNPKHYLSLLSAAKVAGIREIPNY